MSGLNTGINADSANTTKPQPAPPALAKAAGIFVSRPNVAQESSSIPLQIDEMGLYKPRGSNSSNAAELRDQFCQPVLKVKETPVEMIEKLFPQPVSNKTTVNFSIGERRT